MEIHRDCDLRYLRTGGFHMSPLVPFQFQPGCLGFQPGFV